MANLINIEQIEVKNLSKEQAEAELARLSKAIHHHNLLYYQEDAPVISDHEYDQLFIRNKSIEILFPDLIRTDSPSNKVGAVASNKFNKITHTKSMLSLANAFSKEDMIDFYDRILKDLRVNEIEILCELKIDGVSFTAKYDKGNLIYAATRGDGAVGEDVTENIKTIDDFPIDLSKFAVPDILEIRGEIYIDNQNFHNINKQRIEEDQPLFANPRNAAAGSLRQLDSKITKSRRLKYFVHGVGEISDNQVETQSELMNKLKDFGFIINEKNKIVDNIEQISQFYDKVSNIRRELDYEIDGIVYKVNNLILQQRLGFVSRHPRWAIAYKFPAIIKKTIVEDIIIQVGRLGSLSPVAILKPVEIAGVIVSRASLHNRGELERKDIRIGDTVIVKRAGDVIPQIVEVDFSYRNDGIKKFIYPDICPICSSKASIVEDEAAIRCPNSKCPAQILEKLIYFAGRDALNIDGLGERQLKFLLEMGFIKDHLDIFDLQNKEQHKEDKLKNYPGFGDKSIQNLFKSIEKAKNTTIDKFIYSLGIRFIGQTASKILAEFYKNKDKFIHAMKEVAKYNDIFIDELKSINGIGKKMISSLVSFFSNEDNLLFLEKLSNILIIADYTSLKQDHRLSGKIIVFTGELQSLPRREAKNIAEKCGSIISSSISNKTNYVVAGAAAGSKLKKAKELNITILSEDEWLELTKQ